MFQMQGTPDTLFSWATVVLSWLMCSTISSLKWPDSGYVLPNTFKFLCVSPSNYLIYMWEVCLSYLVMITYNSKLITYMGSSHGEILSYKTSWKYWSHIVFNYEKYYKIVWEVFEQKLTPHQPKARAFTLHLCSSTLLRPTRLAPLKLRF